jgi:acetyl/propionyl-CoA carboxylase alpha subunit
VREILAEVKAGRRRRQQEHPPGAQRRETRHNEIQLLGNGEWCVSLGGRDCSLQMHEQKLLEVSLTKRLLEADRQARAAGREARAQALLTDLETLRAWRPRPSASAAPWGSTARRPSSASSRAPRHYFMEVNTRIQVEHRVTELCYALRFTNPADPGDFFEVSSLVEAMAMHRACTARLPRPTRVRREGAAIEARLNATNRALAPHAGGVIHSWSDPHRCPRCATTRASA